jgi:hypothetical protein
MITEKRAKCPAQTFSAASFIESHSANLKKKKLFATEITEITEIFVFFSVRLRVLRGSFSFASSSSVISVANNFFASSYLRALCVSVVNSYSVSSFPTLSAPPK